MSLTLDRAVAGALEARWKDKPLFRYVFEPQVLQREAPRPYFHPLRTLAGDTVTLFHPYDHVHHHGLSMTCACLSGQNFWGGPTYVRAEDKYRDLPNCGTQRHVEWLSLPPGGAAPLHIRERLDWITQGGERWFEEERDLTVAEVNEAEQYWRLDVALAIRNVSGGEKRFGSPTTEGRPLAGYGGFFWRGPRSFHGGRILAGGGLEGPSVMGQRAPWLAYTGRHDETMGTSTLLFVDHPSNPRHPTQWFVRNQDYAGASAALMFDQELPLAAGATLRLRYGLLLADGAWERERLEAAATKMRS